MNYDTKLTPEEEKQYQSWVKQQSSVEGRDISLDTQDYDMRGYWKDVIVGGGAKDKGHYPDTYKKPNHPTFSDESKYADSEHQGGHWDEQGNFHPSEWNLKSVGGMENLKKYFTQYEPNAKLVFSDGQIFYGAK